MNKFVKSLLTLIPLSISVISCSGNSNSITYHVDLGDNDAQLTNPGMGWDFCYYSDRTDAYGVTLKEGDLLDGYPCDIVYFRLGWKYFQPEKDRYDFSLIDDVIKQWTNAGKRYAFRFEVCSPNTMDGQSCPLWLRDECHCSGVEFELYEEAKKYGLTMGEPGVKTWVPDYGDAIFLREFRSFLDEVNTRYGGESLEFVEVGSIGSWGEGHSAYSWPAVIDPQVIPDHLRMHREAFPNTRIMAGDDLVNQNLDSIKLCKELDIGCCDDSVQVDGRYANQDIFDCFDDYAIRGIEHHPGTYATDILYDSLWMSHASYCRLHNNPYHMKTGSQGMVEKVTKRLGYRLSVGSMDMNKPKKGQDLNIKINIQNTGVAYFRDGGFINIIVKDENGNNIATGKSTYNLKSLPIYKNIEKAPFESVPVTVKLPSNLSGVYSINIFIANEDDSVRYNIPLDNGNETKEYRISRFKI